MGRALGDQQEELEENLALKILRGSEEMGGTATAELLGEAEKERHPPRVSAGSWPPRSCVDVNVQLVLCPAAPVIQGWWGEDRTLLSSVQLLSGVRRFAILWTAAHWVSLSITNSQNLLKLMPVESVVLSNHLIACRPLLLLPSFFSSIRVFSNELVLCIRWPKYWSLSFSISPSSEYSGLISFRID